MNNTEHHRFESYIDELMESVAYKFKDWEDEKIGAKEVLPEVSAGVYLVYRGEEFLYAGMAGKEEKTIQAARTKIEKYKKDNPGKAVPVDYRKGLYDRLNQHSLGGLSGDKMNVYIAERFIAPNLTKCQKEQLASGCLSLDQPTYDFVSNELSYKFCLTKSNEAKKLEKMIISGITRLGKPLLNKVKKRKSNRRRSK